MKSFESQVAAFISSNRLIDAGADVIVAVSGGADSVALLLTLSHLGYSCTAAHCNFHLRGQESDRDEQFVTELCRKMNIPLEIIHFDVEARCRATGESVEMACRTLRYDWFASLSKKLGINNIAVAHHADDNAETFLLNLLRGTGIAGLKAMTPRNGSIVRPLLCCRRSDIEQYLQKAHASHITDSTNAQSVFRRNRIRNRIVPALSEQFPDAVSRIVDTISCISDDYLLHTDYAAELTDRYTLSDGSIDVSEICATHPHPQQALYAVTRRNGITREMVRKIIANPLASGKIYAGFLLDRGRLKLRSTEAVTPATLTPGIPPLDMVIRPVSEFKPVRNPAKAWFDVAILDGNPEFQLRGWRISDRMKPFGMRGSRKLSDIFSDSKLDLNQKNIAPVITRNDEIIWLPGIRQSALFPVTSSTTAYVEFTFTPLD